MVIIMKRNFRFNIISEGQKNGVSATCQKYNISRTIYYRWLKRYKTQGIEGLDDLKRSFVPVNKTSTEIEAVLLNLFSTYPHYGPKAINYLLDEMGYNISESAVFNVMKRHHLTNKESRLKFAKNKKNNITPTLPSFNEINSGECWLFWITNYGAYKNTGNIYEYTLYDLKSQIACTRLYNEESFENFEDLLTAVAMPVAQSLHLNIKYLCFYEDNKVLRQLGKTFKSKINKIILDNGFDFKVHILIGNNEDLGQTYEFKNKYTEGCISFLMPLLHTQVTFDEVKVKFQGYVKDYNLNIKSIIWEHKAYSPVQYHNKLANTKLILPIWAYAGRKY